MRNKISISENKMEFIENMFAVALMIYAMLSSNGLTFGKPIIKPFMWASFLLSAVILLYRAFNIKEYFRFPETLLALILVGSIGISTLINRNYSFKSNIVFCIYWVFYFLVLFTTGKSKKTDSIKKSMRIVSVTFISYTTLSAIVGFILYFAGVNKTYAVPGEHYAYYLGFKWGRLWGIFLSPNHGAISCAVSIMLFIYIFKSRKKQWIRICSVLGIILHLMYIVFADSRTGTVVLAAGIATYVFVVCLKTVENKKIGIKILTFAMSLCIAVVCFAGVRQLRKPINGTISLINSQLDKTNNKEHDADIIERGYDLSEDISNRRFDVWKSGVEVFLHSSKNMAFGLSHCGFTEYAEQHLPKTYIVNNDHAVMTTLDNELLNILISNGIFGIVGSVAFVAYIIVFVIKKFTSVKAEDKFFIALNLAILFSLACAAMFASVMFFHFSPNAVFFWLALGQLMTYLNAGENKNGI